ncbi:OsmC family protein [Maribacter sp. R77961]|uniref:OsmC family protein n=1 Tax=Maribacter sp. R77961 TaxID=3093871 RepID=UPI0037CBD4DB
MKKHHYKTMLEWTGNTGEGTTNYKAYQRAHEISIAGKNHNIMGSSDPSFRGDSSRYNPEELFLSSISSCHMLWFLHLCSVHGITVMEYRDNAIGVMEEDKKGSGRFTTVTLHPQVIITDPDMVQKANSLHKEANTMCFIANSCNFKIEHEPITGVKV